MNKYQKAIEVIDTLLHLMCGEEREDGYKPTMEEMSKSMYLLQELVDKETQKKPEIKELIRKDNYKEKLLNAAQYHVVNVILKIKTVTVLVIMK